MISEAAGDKEAARDFIKRSLALNPQFDALQTIAARKITEN